MPKLVTIQPHLEVEELEQRYRQCSDLVESRHYQIIWLLAKGKTTAEVAEVTGYSREWIRRLARRYNQQGICALCDRRHHNPGAEPLLNDVQQAQLWQTLQQSPADGGLWNSRKVADWISQLIDRPVPKQRGWDYLQQMELRLRVPRPSHEEADAAVQEAWKKKLKCKVAQIQVENPDAVVEVWAMDEHRLGLKPVLRRVWVPRGSQPLAQVHWRYQWLWLYGFVHPQSGETYFWILPQVNITLFNQALADFAREFQVGKNKQIILTLDQAGWHTSQQVQIPQGIHLEFMPSHSPELQPAERLWPLTNEPIANRSFSSLDELEKVLFHRCQVLLRHPEFVRAIACYHWWPQVAA